MNSQSPIYSLKFTITWIFVYGIIVFVLWQFFTDRFADAPIGSGDHDDPLRVLFHCNSFCVLVNLG